MFVLFHLDAGATHSASETHVCIHSITCGIFHKLSLCYYFTVTCKVHVLYNLMPAHTPTSCRIL